MSRNNRSENGDALALNLSIQQPLLADDSPEQTSEWSASALGFRTPIQRPLLADDLPEQTSKRSALKKTIVAFIFATPSAIIAMSGKKNVVRLLPGSWEVSLQAGAWVGGAANLAINLFLAFLYSPLNVPEKSRKAARKIDQAKVMSQPLKYSLYFIISMLVFIAGFAMAGLTYSNYDSGMEEIYSDYKDSKWTNGGGGLQIFFFILADIITMTYRLELLNVVKDSILLLQHPGKCLKLLWNVVNERISLSQSSPGEHKKFILSVFQNLLDIVFCLLYAYMSLRYVLIDMYSIKTIQGIAYAQRDLIGMNADTLLCDPDNCQVSPALHGASILMSVPHPFFFMKATWRPVKKILDFITLFPHGNPARPVTWRGGIRNSVVMMMMMMTSVLGSCGLAASFAGTAASDDFGDNSFTVGLFYFSILNCLPSLDAGTYIAKKRFKGTSSSSCGSRFFDRISNARTRVSEAFSHCFGQS